MCSPDAVQIEPATLSQSKVLSPHPRGVLNDAQALMLLNQVGTGTDPAEGAALGIALLRALVAGGPRGAAFTMATTHHRCCAPPHMITIDAPQPC